MKRLGPVILIMVVVLSAAAACATGPAEKNVSSQPSKADGNYSVRIGFPSSARDTLAPDGPDIWGIEKGFFAQEFRADGIAIEYKPFLAAAPAINEALGAGSLEMAYIADIGALIGKASGLKTSLVAMGNPDGVSWWLVVLSSSKIQKVAELKGKKVATVKATAPHFYLLKALEANGLKASDVELINMTLPDSEQALRAGQIDATVTGSWFGVRLLSQGVRAIDSTKETPIGKGTIVIVATDSFITNHPSFFPRYFKARQRATDWANANRDMAFDLLTKNFGGVERKLLEPLYTNPFNYDQRLSAGVLARIKEGENFLRDLGLTRTAVDVNGWINNTVAYKKP
ncbi:MAG: ABC transporter substrate-binding protein [Chloroflexi bacterium]|nr:ABC transporter substrate-binding protein [Chloroflexota bacterium]